MVYREDQNIRQDPTTGQLVAKQWVVIASGVEGRNKRRFVNVIDIFDNKQDALNHAASVRNSRLFKAYRDHKELKIHVRPNWDTEDDN